MFKVEKHVNSKEYFTDLKIEEDALYIFSNSSLKYALLECNKNLKEDDIWRVNDIETIILKIYPVWENLLVKVKLKAILRDILAKRINNENDKFLKREYEYLMHNIEDTLIEIKKLYYVGVYNIKVNYIKLKLKAFKEIYNEFIENEYFFKVSNELRNVKSLRDFYKNIEGYNNLKIKKIYFYNFSEIDLERFKLIDTLNLLGYEIVFRIPYYDGLNKTNKCWDNIYNINGFFEFENRKTSDFSHYIYNNSFISMIEEKNTIKSNENVEVIEYSSISEFNYDNKERYVTTFLKNDLESCMKGNTLDLEHGFESNLGRFLYFLYDCDICDNDVNLDFKTYFELITSGWIEDKNNGINGVRFKEYLILNCDYFKDVKSINEILERIERLKDINEINELFESKIKSRINKSEAKKFLSNPFRAYGFANFGKFNITANYLEIITKKLKRFILNAFKGTDNLINYSNHINELKKLFNNTYITLLRDENNELIEKIQVSIENRKIEKDYIHKDELRSIFSTILSINAEVEEEVCNFSLNLLEGNILRRRKLNKFKGEQIIHISDLSFKSFKKYIYSKKDISNILLDNERLDIISDNINEFDRINLNILIDLDKRSRNNFNEYINFALANLFINFEGKIRFSWIKNLRKNDTESILYKQLEKLYTKNKSQNISMDFMNEINEDDLQEKYINFSKKIEKDYIECKKLPEVAFRDLDFCEKKFMLTSLINDYPIYFNDFHNKIILGIIISNIKATLPDCYFEIKDNIIPLFSQWSELEKENILSTVWRSKTLREYKLFDGVNYPKVIDKMYILRSKYIVTERYKIKNRYLKNEDMKIDDLYKDFVKSLNENKLSHSGRHCSMCPHIFACKEGEFTNDANR